MRNKKVSKLFKWSREGWPCGTEEGGYIFEEEILELAPFAMVFATGPEDRLKSRYFYCMIWKKMSRNSSGIYELKKHLQ